MALPNLSGLRLAADDDDDDYYYDRSRRAAAAGTGATPSLDLEEREAANTGVAHPDPRVNMRWVTALQTPNQGEWIENSAALRTEAHERILTDLVNGIFAHQKVLDLKSSTGVPVVMDDATSGSVSIDNWYAFVDPEAIFARPAAEGSWNAAGFLSGQRLEDIGAPPGKRGFITKALANFGPSGRVIARVAKLGQDPDEHSTLEDQLMELCFATVAANHDIGPKQYVSIFKLNQDAKDDYDQTSAPRTKDGKLPVLTKSRVKSLMQTEVRLQCDYIMTLAEAYDGDCSGLDIDAVVTEEGPNKGKLVLSNFWEMVAQTIVHASNKGFLHGDLKPPNMLYRWEDPTKRTRIAQMRYTDFDPSFVAILDMENPVNREFVPCICVLMLSCFLAELRCVGVRKEEAYTDLAESDPVAYKTAVELRARTRAANAWSALMDALRAANLEHKLPRTAGDFREQVHLLCYAYNEASSMGRQLNEMFAGRKMDREAQKRAKQSHELIKSKLQLAFTNYFQERPITRSEKKINTGDPEKETNKKQDIVCMSYSTTFTLVKMVAYALGFPMDPEREEVLDPAVPSS